MLNNTKTRFFGLNDTCPAPRISSIFYLNGENQTGMVWDLNGIEREDIVHDGYAGFYAEYHNAEWQSSVYHFALSQCKMLCVIIPSEINIEWSLAEQHYDECHHAKA